MNTPRLLLSLLLLIPACDFSAVNKELSSQDNDITNIDNSINNSDESEPTFGSNPQCSQGTNSIDGPGGFLWKPESEGDGKLVLLFPTEFITQFLNVLMERVEGTFENATFTGFSNGARQTWRGQSTGIAYTGRVVVDAGNQECEWVVPDPTVRQD